MDGLIYSNVVINLESVYNKNKQSVLFSRIEAATGCKKSITIDNLRFLAKGHLAPMGDFNFGALQIGTFHFANAAPQWQSFNGGNWLKLENAVRNWAVQSQSKLTVYTGTYGTFAYGGKDVYLTVDRNGKSIVPVPAVFWKVVFDEAKNEAVAFVGLNDMNGNVEENPAKTVCREDLCDRIRWVDFPADPFKGLMYCCEVSDFSATVKTMPDLGPVKLLVGETVIGQPSMANSDSADGSPKRQTSIDRSKSGAGLLERKPSFSRSKSGNAGSPGRKPSFARSKSDTADDFDYPPPLARSNSGKRSQSPMRSRSRKTTDMPPLEDGPLREIVID